MTYPSAQLETAELENRILIVEDELAVRTMFFECLSPKYKCSTASNFDEAFSQLSVRSYSLVLTDLIMPGRGGIELLREITNRWPDTVVVVVSGVDRSQRVIDAIRLGASDYLVKPCDLDVLELTIERALERRALVRESRRYKINLERQNKILTDSKAQLERLQAQIIQAEKMASLGQLAAGVAHELNNPAGYILGNLEILTACGEKISRLVSVYGGLNLTQEQSELIRTVKSEIDYENTLSDLCEMIQDCKDGAARIRDVVSDLTTFSRMDQVDRKRIDIHEGIESSIRILSGYFNNGAITITRNYAELPPIDCYAGQLNQVWMNLLVNAAQAVGTEGEVSVTTRRSGEFVVISISDNGCGMPEDQLARIFDPFFTTKPVGDGTGLGLSVTYSIVERHFGSIDVKSSPGIGTTFQVKIPVDGLSVHGHSEITQGGQ